MDHLILKDLESRGLISREQHEEYARLNGNGARSLEAELLESGAVTEPALLEALGGILGVPVEHVAGRIIPPEAARSLAKELIQKHRVLPLSRNGNTLTIATGVPFSREALEEVRFASGLKLHLVLAPSAEIHQMIEENFDVTVEQILEGLSQEAEGNAGQDQFFIHDLEQKASEPTLINLVNLIISEAIDEGASDIHVEPFEREMRVKYRIDGILQEMPPPPNHLQPAIVSRIKIMAGMDIAKRHIPQDGYIRINLNHAQVDIRVATVPTIFGEGVVMRLLNKSAILIGLEELGLGDSTFRRLEPLLLRNYGIELVCGPTGSGKTTTLYAVLNHIFTPEKKIITIEDPVEYQLDGINQIPVRPGRGVTFSTGLRSILRLDPDILLVGEIRDKETAEIAIRSALTGHLIFSTLHTNDAASAVTRLLDMGIEPYLIASSLQCALAQRLVRKLCHHCRAPFNPSNELLAQFEHSRGEAVDADFYRASGCAACKNRGYIGRIGIFELLELDENLQNMIIRSENSHAIKDAARASMTTMREDGWNKVCRGITTFEEVLRTTQRDQGDSIAALDE